MRRDELKEFSQFLSERVEPPREVSDRILSLVSHALNPPIGWTALKVLLFHVLGSTVTLFFCPQYGISFGGNSQGIMPYLMSIHPAVCFAACGLIWMIGGQALSYSFLTIDEKRVLGSYRWGSAFAVIGMSLLLFACLGSLIFDMWLALWILGALFIAIVCNWKIDHKLRRLSELALVNDN